MINIYGKDQCPRCDMAKNIAEQGGVEYVYKKLGVDYTKDELLEKFPGAMSVPQISSFHTPLRCYPDFIRYQHTSDSSLC